jgi:hypothetical protein
MGQKNENNPFYNKLMDGLVSKCPNKTQAQDGQPLDNDEFIWAYEIMKFFEISNLYQLEKQSALKIEDFFVRCK